MFDFKRLSGVIIAVLASIFNLFFSVMEKVKRKLKQRFDFFVIIVYTGAICYFSNFLVALVSDL